MGQSRYLIFVRKINKPSNDPAGQSATSYIAPRKPLRLIYYRNQLYIHFHIYANKLAVFLVTYFG